MEKNSVCCSVLWSVDLLKSLNAKDWIKVATENGVRDPSSSVDSFREKKDIAT